MLHLLDVVSRKVFTSHTRSEWVTRNEESGALGWIHSVIVKGNWTELRVEREGSHRETLLLLVWEHRTYTIVPWSLNFRKEKFPVVNQVCTMRHSQTVMVRELLKGLGYQFSCPRNENPLNCWYTCTCCFSSVVRICIIWVLRQHFFTFNKSCVTFRRVSLTRIKKIIANTKSISGFNN